MGDLMRSKYNLPALVTCTLFTMTLFLACADENPNEPEGEIAAEETSTFDVTVVNHTRIVLEAVSGTTEISGTPGATAIHIEAERRVTADNMDDAESYLDSVQVQVSDMTDSVFVKTIQPDDTGDKGCSVNYQITLPANFEVSIMNVNGIVEVESIENLVKVGNVNGNVVLGDISGNTFITNVSGTITSEVTLQQDGTIDQSTVSGNIHLDIPQNTSAEILATATSGTVSIVNLDFEDEDTSPGYARGTLGGGQGTVTLQTTSGNIIITGF